MHEPFAVTPWELEAERRREVVEADVRAARHRVPRDPKDAAVRVTSIAWSVPLIALGVFLLV